MSDCAGTVCSYDNLVHAGESVMRRWVLREIEWLFQKDGIMEDESPGQGIEMKWVVLRGSVRWMNRRGFAATASRGTMGQARLFARVLV